MKTFSKICISIGIVSILLGAVLIAVGFSNGGEPENFHIPFRNNDKKHMNYQYEEKFENIKKLDLDINNISLEIRKGKEFSVQAENLEEEAFSCYVEDGTLIVKDKTKKYFKLLRFFSSVGENTWENYRVIITVPKDFQAEDFQIDLGKGEIVFDEFYTERADFTIGAGSLQGDRLVVEKEAKINIGAGSMEVANVKMNNTTLRCGVGEIGLHGTITGENVIECGVGGVNLSLSGSWLDYNYDMSCGIGDININKEDNSDFVNITGRSKKIDNSAQNRFKLKCGLGNIDLDFGM